MSGRLKLGFTEVTGEFPVSTSDFKSELLVHFKSGYGNIWTQLTDEGGPVIQPSSKFPFMHRIMFPVMKLHYEA